MTDKEFEEIVNKGIKAIDNRFLKRLENVEICIEDEPDSFQLEKIKARKGSLIFGLYEGVPQTKRWGYGQVLPDKITIFKKSIEEVCSSREEMIEMVKNTVWHEIAHHFGMDEKEVKEAENKRR
ncbi:MAG: metallopeptidase family protein [Candidatus Pacebacteria bacterium]|nr:metallopeptidase family protein [Candidatus Paceibacterota bacterium]